MYESSSAKENWQNLQLPPNTALRQMKPAEIMAANSWDLHKVARVHEFTRPRIASKPPSHAVRGKLCGRARPCFSQNSKTFLQSYLNENWMR